MRASRLLSMLLLLQARGRSSAPSLARELEVSVRTVYRDVDALGAAGVPLHTEAGRDGGIVLRDDYRFRLTGLTGDEASALPLAGLAQVASDLGLGAAAGAAQLKLLASLPAASGKGARRLAARVHVDPVPWYHRGERLDQLPALAAAVWGDRRLVLDYQSWSRRSRMRVDPLGLVQKGGLWYLVALSRGRPRSFRVSSIVTAEVLDASALRPVDFDLGQCWARSVADFERRLRAGRARVRLSPAARQLLRDELPAAAEHVDATAGNPGPDGWVEAELPVEGIDHAARQLLRLGQDVEVLAPAALRAAVVREARAVLARHGRERREAPRAARPRRQGLAASRDVLPRGPRRLRDP
ncbi:MAG: WYL domain-containing protein [Steroidobacteraceae bacterium]